ncbi:hypothetical protein [Nitrosovibrio sp. Nv17]|uniref:hypothetical protein n=1 Tax=Nitrosovibrio sp. Nv17 TaxID=1855339 RepID=UPI000931FCDA|nr:hypothetical protein [Nitrosovibrio sp. Nv17]
MSVVLDAPALPGLLQNEPGSDRLLQSLLWCKARPSFQLKSVTVASMKQVLTGPGSADVVLSLIKQNGNFPTASQ